MKCLKCGHEITPLEITPDTTCPSCGCILSKVSPEKERAAQLGRLKKRAENERAEKNKHRNLIIRLALAALMIFSVVSIARLSSEIRKNESKTVIHTEQEAVYNSPFDGSVRQAERYIKANLKDPTSFEAIKWSKVIKENGRYRVGLIFRAKNSFGGYTIEQYEFILTSTGDVEEAQKIVSK